MADNDIGVVASDLSVKFPRFVYRNSIPHQGVLVAEMPELVPTLTGATIVYGPITTTRVDLVPPTATAHYCRIRVWHSLQDPTVRLFYREDGTNPTADGLNAEGYLVHGDAYVVRVTTQANFRMIGVTGMAGSFTVYASWRNSA